ncbi:MAG TPA: hypothetical protein PKD85_22085, partial [Saprospiraceae bacterium]|nr:hypothetical protein [Saprospiraceae bacterium]
YSCSSVIKKKEKEKIGEVLFSFSDYILDEKLIQLSEEYIKSSKWDSAVTTLLKIKSADYQPYKFSTISSIYLKVG